MLMIVRNGEWDRDIVEEEWNAGGGRMCSLLPRRLHEVPGVMSMMLMVVVLMMMMMMMIMMTMMLILLVVTMF